MEIPLASNGLNEHQISDAIDVLRSGNLTMGQRVKSFESLMSEYLGTKNFVMVNSGSSANLAMIEYLLRPTHGAPLLDIGDEVLVPAIAWPTTIWPLVQLGLRPRFVDIDPQTLQLDLDKAQVIVDESRTIKAIFPIHVLGLAFPTAMLEEFASRNRLVLINDVCESLGSWNSGIHTGLGGLGGSFSFYFSHHITTMEGGGVGTDSDEMADDLRSIRSHGWSRDRNDSDAWHRGISATDRHFTFVSAGYNIRPMEIQAAVGLSEVPRIDEYVGRRRAIAREVNQALVNSGLHLIGSHTFADSLEKSHSWMHLPVQIIDDRIQKSKLLGFLNSAGVATRPVLTGNFLHQPSAQRFIDGSQTPSNFPDAEAVSESSFLVGCHHSLSDNQVSYLAETLSSGARAARS